MKLKCFLTYDLNQNHFPYQTAQLEIVLGKCGGWDAAFLIQNAFPTTTDYFDHIHTSKGIPLTLHGGTAKLIADNLKNNLRLHKRGISLFYADIDRIYDIMVNNINSEK